MATADLLVIGGGFWGTAIAHTARAQGMDVQHLDDFHVNGASRNAAGIICRNWYRQETVRRMLPHDWSLSDVDQSLEWLQQHAGLRQTGEQFWSYQKPQERHRSDVYLIPSCSAVLTLSEPEMARVDSLRYEGDWVVETKQGTFRAPKIAIAAGAQTDHILRQSGLQETGVRALRGRALILRTQKPIGTPLTYMARPYSHFTLRDWGAGELRLGDTVERTPGLPIEKTPLLQMQARMRGGSEIVGILDGMRPVCERFTVVEIAPNCVVATGGHRVGLGLAGAVGRRAVQLLQRARAGAS